MKRLFALALALCMVLALLPATAMAEETHTHCACAQAFTGLDADKCADHKEGQTWEKLDPANLPTTGGYYYLTADLVLSAQWYVKGDLNICTNGYDITRASTAAGDLFGLIRVDNGKSLTITNCKAQIANGKLVLTDPAKNSVLSGAKSSNTSGAMFHVNANATLKLYGVEVSDNTTTSANKDGWGAGAVLACNTGITMDIAYSAFRNNSSTDSTNGNGGAIVVRGGTTNIRNTSFSGNTANVNGGALYVCNDANATVTLTNCSFTGNEAVKSGGAVYALKGSVTATNCSFTENKATGSDAQGGAALYVKGGTTTLNMVTMTANENAGYHGSAITQDGGNLAINSCTITGNINADEGYRAGVVVIGGAGSTSISGNTVIDNNINSTTERNIFLRYNNVQPKLTVDALTAGAQMTVATIDDMEAADYLIATAKTPNFTAQDGYITYDNRAAAADKKYGIAYNGTAFSYDVVGHYHAECACAITGVTCKDHTSTEASKVLWTAWDATASANYKTTLPTASGYYYLTEDVTLSAQYKIGEKTAMDVVICTNGKDITSQIALGDTYGVFRVYKGSNLTITNCQAQIKEGRLDTSEANKTSTLSGGITKASAGGMIQAYQGVDLAIFGVEFKDNESQSGHDTWGAGAILCVGADGTNIQNLTVAYSAFDGNRATLTGGGAITLFGGTADIRNTTFTNNYAAKNGGAINMVNAATALTLRDCDFTNNGFVTAEQNGETVATVKTASGGALHVGKGSVNATNVTFTGNRATTNGGAVYTAATKVEFADSAFRQNTAASGGAINAAAGELKATNTEFVENEASTDSGAVYTAATTVEIATSTFSKNTATTGGAIKLGGGVAQISNTAFTENISKSNGAIYVYRGNATLTNVTMTGNDNTTGANGSAVTVEGSATLALNNCTITGNNNNYDGNTHAAVVLVDGATFSISGKTVIKGNINGKNERNILLRYINSQPTITVNQLTEGADISVMTTQTTEGVHTVLAPEDPDTFLVKGVTGDWNPAWNLGWISYSDGRSVGHNETDGFYFVAAHTEGGVTYKPWSSTTALPASGNYYLLGNVTLAEAVALEDADLKLCLNGNAVTGAQISLDGTTKLGIADCGEGSFGVKLVIAESGATINASGAIAVELGGNEATINGGTVTLTDSATNEGEVGGKAYGNFTIANRVSKNGDISYVILDSADGAYKTANAVRVKLTRVSIRPAVAGIYYTTSVQFNENVVDAIVSANEAAEEGKKNNGYGVVLSTDNMPDDKFMTGDEATTNRWTQVTPVKGEDFRNEVRSCLVSGVFKDDVLASENATRGTTPIYANGYVKLTVDGQDVVIMAENVNPVVHSMQTVMQGMDDKLATELQNYAAGTGELSADGEKVLDFFKTWQTAMAGWELPNLTEAAKKAA